MGLFPLPHFFFRVPFPIRSIICFVLTGAESWRSCGAAYTVFFSDGKAFEIPQLILTKSRGALSSQHAEFWKVEEIDGYNV
jgi:hypothetical protein